MTDYKYAIGARVTVRDGTTLFHTRTQAFTRGKTGVVVDTGRNG